MLEVRSLSAGYGSITILRDVSLSVPAGKIVGLLGANGAGKSTLIRALSGLATIHAGTITFLGESIAGSTPQALVCAGLVHVPQGRMLFGEMTVRENLEMGAYLIPDQATFAAQLARVHALFPILEERAMQPAAFLSGGEQQMLAVGRALMAKPRCLLLDEPSLGLGPKIFDTILDTVRVINAEGTPVLIAEQNARKILKLAHFVYVLENGRVVQAAESGRLLTDEQIRASYFGVS
jgi:branched-chain amino acid transport system ATP-binding protein